MNSVLLWIGGLLVAVLGLLFAAPYVIDWNAYRGVFEEEASRVLGRDVRVGGKVNLRLLPAPYVRFEKIRISDTTAMVGEPLFRAEAFTLWLATAPLLRGAIEASRIELEKPVLRLAIDAEGKGNWQSLRIAPGSMPFIPSDVAFQNLDIKDGAISLRAANGNQPIAISSIDGELSATALAGPYRFRGQLSVLRKAREVRLSTSTLDAAGGVRFKTAIHDVEGGGSYTLDGALSALAPEGRVTGALTARLPIRSPDSATPASSSTEQQPAADPGAIDVRANFDGNANGLKLTELALAFEQNGRPQLLNGEAVASWANDLRLETRLTSRWLDLDRLATGVGATTPLTAARRLIEQLGPMLPIDGTTFATVDVDQVNLGGGALSGVRLAIARTGGLTSIGELKAALPGNSRVMLRGTLGAGGPDSGFDGDLTLYGASLGRFWTWATGDLAAAASKPAATVPVAGDAPFVLASRMKLMPNRLVLDNANIEFSRSQAQTDVDLRWGKVRSLVLDVEGDTIDLSALLPGALDFLEHAKAGVAPADPLKLLASKARALEAAVGALTLKVAADRLSDGKTVVRNVSADLKLEQDRLAVNRLEFLSQDGLTTYLDANLTKVTDDPVGLMKGWVHAETPAALRELVAGLTGPKSPLAPQRIAAIGRAHVGFNLAVGGGERPGRVALMANGTVGDGNLNLAMTLDGGFGNWRKSPIELNLRFESPDLPAVLRRLASTRRSTTTAPPSPPVPASTAGTWRLTAAGSNAEALLANAVLQTRGIRMTYRGELPLGEDGGIAVKGDADIDVSRLDDLIAVAAPGRHPSLAADKLAGTIRIEGTPRAYKLAARSLRLGNTRLAGVVQVKPEGERVSIDGTISASRASAMDLLGIVLDASRKPGQQPSAEPELASAWPDAPFSMLAVSEIDARIAVSAPSFELAGGLAIADASAKLELGPARFALADISGTALGGKLTGRVVIEPGPAGAKVEVAGRLEGAPLSRLSGRPGSGDRGSQGFATLALELSGRGISPSGVIPVMSGKGEVRISGGRVRGISDDAIDKSAFKIIESNEEVSRERIETTLRREMAAGTVAIGDARLAISVAGGVARIAPLEVRTPHALLRNLTTVELATLKGESEWRIKPLRPLVVGNRKTRAEPLPDIDLVWTGSLAEIARVDPRASVDVLERELATRKLERDAERLEELRRQDEERARVEAERMRRLDDAARGPGAADTAPIIVAPFPIPATPRSNPQPSLPPQKTLPKRQSANEQLQQALPSNGGPLRPATEGSAPGSQRPVERPPPRRFNQPRSLQDMLMNPQ